MNHTFRTGVNKLQSHPILDSTHNLAALDAGFAALAESAATRISEPTILLTQARHFETLFPSCFRNCPAFVIWLPLSQSMDIFDLAYTKPIVYGRTSPDLRERDLMIAWGHDYFTYASFATPLLPSMEVQQDGGAIPMIFATQTHAAASVLSMDSDLLDALNLEAGRCSTNYQPRSEHSAEMLHAAAKRKRDPFEFELDPNGRSVMLLRPRRAVRPGQLV